MSWFTEQIKERKKRDDALLEEAFGELNRAITGKGLSEGHLDEKRAVKYALDRILLRLHYPKAELPAEEVPLEEQLEYAMHPHGVMWRKVVLEKGWYKNAVGPMLGRRSGDGTWVALLPGKITGYYYADPGTGAHVRLNRHTQEALERDAYCFYNSFPAKSFGIPGLLSYMLKSISPTTYLLLGLMTLGITLVGMLTPYLTYLMYSTVLASRSLQMLLAIATFALCTGISTTLLTLVRTVAEQRLNTQLNLSVEAAAMARILSLPPDFFRNYTAGELSSKMQSLSLLCSSMVAGVFSLGLTSLFSIVYVFQIFRYTPVLVVPSLVILLLTLAHTVAVTLIQFRIVEKRMDTAAKLDGLTFGLVSGIQKIKLSGSEKRALSRWLKLFSKNARLTYRLPFLVLHAEDISLALSLVGQFVLYYLAVQSGITIAEYNAFGSAYGLMAGAFMSLVGIAATLGQIRPILKIAEPIMKAVPENSEQKKMVKKFSGGIEFSHVSFRYTDTMPYVVNNLSFKIEPGQYVAVVGKTGCGKSTLVRLLLGFETPERGAVYYDNRDVKTLDPKSLRRSIGTVLQDGKLMTGDIYANITVAAPWATQEDAWAAAEMVGIAEDIREMPMGMNTMITEAGGGISGGQRQRLMIARAVVGKPRILIFDEATSALDNITQKQVSDALNALKCTRIVIAHRLSTIRQCDRILFLEGGEIVEDGTYEELIDLGGRFAQLVERQRLEE